MNAVTYIAALFAILVMVKIALNLAQGHKLALLQAIWLRKRDIERAYSKIAEHPSFSAEIYFKITRAELPSNHEEATAMEIICRKYLEYYYALETAKRDFLSLRPADEATRFLEYCDEKQGSINVVLHNCLIHSDLSKYVFQGPIVDDESLLKEFHKIRERFKDSVKNGKAREKENA